MTSLTQSGQPGIITFVIEETDIAGATKSQGSNKGLQRPIAAADNGEIDLHLFTGGRFKTDDSARGVMAQRR